MDADVAPRTVTYWGISFLSSRTMWWNFANLIVAMLSLTEIVVLIPPQFLPLQAALVAVVNLWLRMVTVRPVAMVMPGHTAPVDVAKISPPDPPAVTD